MALSPWPSTPAALQNATAEVRRGLGLQANDTPAVFDETDLNLQRHRGGGECPDREVRAGCAAGGERRGGCSDDRMAARYHRGLALLPPR